MSRDPLLNDEALPTAEQDAAADILKRSWSNPSVLAVLRALVTSSKALDELPTKHLGYVRWCSEISADEAVQNGSEFLQDFVNKVEESNGGDPTKTNPFSVLCHNYRLYRDDVELRKGKILRREYGTAGSLGSAILAFTLSSLGPAAYGSGIACTFLVALCAIDLQAQQGSLVRVNSLCNNYGQAIEALAGSKFLEGLKEVKSDREFLELFEKEGIKCQGGLFSAPNSSIVQRGGAAEGQVRRLSNGGQEEMAIGGAP